VYIISDYSNAPSHPEIHDMINTARPPGSALNVFCWLVSLVYLVLLPAQALAEQSLLNINDGFDWSTVTAQAVELSIVSTDDWQGKTHSQAELAVAIEQERSEHRTR